MLLEHDETQTPTHETLKRCSKTSWLQNDIYPTAPCALAEILPRPPCAPTFNKSRFFRILQFTYLLRSLHFRNSLYVYTRGILGCLLGFWPLDQNPAGGNYGSGPIHTHITPGSRNILVYLYVEHL